MNPPDRKPYLPSVLTAEEFAFLTRIKLSTVRTKIRGRAIKSFGREARIPCRELEKYGVNLQDAAILLAARKNESVSRAKDATKFLNQAQLARELGISTWLPGAVMLAGKFLNDSAFLGRYTTLERFINWLERHPNFIPSAWRTKRFRTNKLASLIALKTLGAFRADIPPAVSAAVNQPTQAASDSQRSYRKRFGAD